MRGRRFHSTGIGWLRRISRVITNENGINGEPKDHAPSESIAISNGTRPTSSEEIDTLRLISRVSSSLARASPASSAGIWAEQHIHTVAHIAHTGFAL